MYEEYFGLDRPPFKISPDTSLFFEGGKRGDILAALVYAVHRGEGIVKVVGEVGSGKTMLCRMLQLELPKTVEIIYIGNPSVSAEDILFVIAHELELHASKDASKHEVMHMLHDYLLQRHIENKQVVLFIEEAQGMPLETLEEIRLLSNLETSEHKLLQIILFGQPELDENLSNKSIRQLRERITHNFNLPPLTSTEIHKYLNFRIREVGYTGPELITENLAKKVEKHSNGLLRRINIIADKILLSAFSESTHNLTPHHVVAAVNDSDFSGKTQKNSRTAWWMILPILIALAFAAYKTEILWLDTFTQLKAGLSGFLEKQSPETAIGKENLENATENTVKKADNGQQLPEKDAAQQVVVEDQPNLIVEDQPGPDSPLIKNDEVVSVEIATNESAIPAEPEVKQEPPVANESVALIEPLAVETQVASSDSMEINEPKVSETLLVADEQIAVTSSDAGNLALEQGQSATSGEASDFESVEQLHNGTQSIAEEVEFLVPIEEVSAIDAKQTEVTTISDYNDNEWLDFKLKRSREWLIGADKEKVSIQVLLLKKSGAQKLAYLLRHDWPLNLDETYLYEVNSDSRVFYRVFYRELDNVAQGRREIQNLPESIRANSPYVHSVYRMQKVFL
jgi:type II secretory pathway predicted ATPase ExeA